MNDDFNNIIHDGGRPLAPISPEHKYVMYLNAKSKFTKWEYDTDDPFGQLLYVNNTIEQWLLDNFDVDGINWTIDRVTNPNSCNLYMNEEVASAFKMRWL